jgi:hypothetical protein
VRPRSDAAGAVGTLKPLRKDAKGIKVLEIIVYRNQRSPYIALIAKSDKNISAKFINLNQLTVLLL